MSYVNPALRDLSERFLKVTSTSQPPGVLRSRAAVTCTSLESPRKLRLADGLWRDGLESPASLTAAPTIAPAMRPPPSPQPARESSEAPISSSRTGHRGF